MPNGAPVRAHGLVYLSRKQNVCVAWWPLVDGFVCPTHSAKVSQDENPCQTALHSESYLSQDFFLNLISSHLPLFPCFYHLISFLCPFLFPFILDLECGGLFERCQEMSTVFIIEQGCHRVTTEKGERN